MLAPPDEEACPMAVAFIQEFPIVTNETTNYDAIDAELDVEHNPVDGLILHTAGFDHDAGVFRIFDVWADAGSAKSFYEGKLAPLIAKVFANDPNAAPPTREASYELYKTIP
jgi:hypothetical protein